MPRRASMGAMIVVLTTMLPRSSAAQDPSKGQATLGGEAVTFAPPLGILDAARKLVSVVFTAEPLSAAAEEANRKAGRGSALTASHGLAWRDADNKQVRLAVFDHAPPAALLSDLRKGISGEGGQT